MKPILIIRHPHTAGWNIADEERLIDSFDWIKQMIKDDYYTIAVIDHEIKSTQFELISPFQQMKELTEEEINKITHVLFKQENDIETIL